MVLSPKKMTFSATSMNNQIFSCATESNSVECTKLENNALSWLCCSVSKVVVGGGNDNDEVWMRHCHGAGEEAASEAWAGQGRVTTGHID